MRTFLIIGLITVVTSLQAQPHTPQDSIKIDKRRIEKVIKKIKKQSTFKRLLSIGTLDRRKVTFSYPDKFERNGGFGINVLYKGEIILIYGINPDTYEVGEIVDLR